MELHRPYRAALGMNKAPEEIESGAGPLYDAQAAAACLRLFRDKQYRIPGGDLR
jgi:HD-GYP domain-containing protein (c-di-GMP phosphodiesterase class II)